MDESIGVVHPKQEQRAWVVPNSAREPPIGSYKAPVVTTDLLGEANYDVPTLTYMDPHNLEFILNRHEESN